MEEAPTVLCTDSRSLWNFTLSPGWTAAESEVLRMALMKFGVGNWKALVASKVLPRKTVAQLNLQTQRLLGQQSLAVFVGLHVDPLRVGEWNAKKTDVVRKGTLIINTGDNPTAELTKKVRKQLAEQFQLSDEEIAAVVIPELEEKDMSTMISKSSTMSRVEKLARLQALHARLAKLRAEEAVLSTTAARARAMARKRLASAAGDGDCDDDEDFEPARKRAAKERS